MTCPTVAPVVWGLAGLGVMAIVGAGIAWGGFVAAVVYTGITDGIDFILDLFSDKKGGP